MKDKRGGWSEAVHLPHDRNRKGQGYCDGSPQDRGRKEVFQKTTRRPGHRQLGGEERKMGREKEVGKTKRWLFWLLQVAWVFGLLSTAQARVTINCTALTGGATRALDSYSISDIGNNDRAIVAYTSGTSTYIGFYQYDSSGTTPENTSTHPFYVRPDDYVSAGVWVELPFAWVDLVGRLSINDLTVIDLVVSGTNTVVNLDASGRLSGALPITGVTSGNVVTLSGASLYGGMTSNPDGTGGCTVTVGEAVKGMSHVFALAKDMIAGSTMFILFNASDKIINASAFVGGSGSGTSYYFLSDDTTSGVTGEGISIIAVADNTWYVYEDGSPTQGSDY